MIGKILKKDLRRKKLVTLVVFGFILLSAMLVASGCNLIFTLSRSLDGLFTKADIPHFIQTHTGTLNQEQLANWSEENNFVSEFQVVEMLAIDGSSIYLGDRQDSEADTVMDISFVVQNTDFDFLLDLNNEIIEVAPDEIAVPIYFMQDAGLTIGDTVRVQTATVDMTFTIVAFVRDAQMNPAIIHSKRFVIHPTDYEALRQHIHDVEYLIEFQLTDTSQVSEFRNQYLAAEMPNRGQSLDGQLFTVLNGLTDGLLAGVVIFLSFLLIVIAILCLRFTILATLEEDYREIGILKGIGISKWDIQRLYLAKYLALGASGSILGYGISLLLNQVLTANITLYSGVAPRSLMTEAIPLIAAASIFIIVTVSCVIVLRRFERISAVQALRSGKSEQSATAMQFLKLARSTIMNLNIFLGLRDVVQRFHLYWLPGMVYVLCAVIVILPLHFLNTIQSPDFISYMGIGYSDIRIDPRQSDDPIADYNNILQVLENDPAVRQFSPLVTIQYPVLLDDSSQDMLNIETGDFTVFPLDYIAGAAPIGENEIALSILNAQDMNKQVGDTITVLIDGQETYLTVTGTYQDVTYGGRTAKATLTPDLENMLWYTISVDVQLGISINEMVHDYAVLFDFARVTDIDGYIAQTMGNTISQMQTATWITAIVGVSVAILITSLFLNMLISKDSGQIAIKRSMGFSLQHIRLQYLSTTLFLLVIGITAGTVFANTGGQGLVSAVWENFGAARIQFVINPLMAYILLPLVLIAAVSITTLFNMSVIKASNIAEMIKQ